MAQYELNIHDYWRIIRKRKWIIIMTTVSVLGSAAIFTNMQVPVYQASATIKVEPSLVIPGLQPDQSGWDVYSAMNTELKIIKSNVISEKTAKKLNLLPPGLSEAQKLSIISGIAGKVSAEKMGESNLISISATSSDPKETARLANATAEVYLEKGIEDRSRRANELKDFISTQLRDAEVKLKNSEDTLRRYTEQSGAKGIGGYLSTNLLNLQGRKTDLLNKYTRDHPEIKRIDQQIEETEKEMKALPAEELEYARLNRALKLNEELYTLLAKRFKEAEINAADRVQPASIVTRANEPSSPISPNKRLNLLVGAFLGIFLGFVLCLLIENLDTSIGTIEDVEKFLNLPVIGIIPRLDLDAGVKAIIPKKINQSRAIEMRYKLIAFHSSKSPFVESYHTLRTNLKLTFLKDPHKILAFTSAGISEGKTLTACNFALAAAQSGIKTLLVETDLRRPSIHFLFGISRSPGFSDMVLGTKPWRSVVKGTTDYLMSDIGTDKILKIPGIENLSMVTSGPIMTNPIDILNSPITGQVLQEMKQEYELVILDCPPALLFADALIIGNYTDGMVIVYQVGRMARQALKRTKDQLANVKTQIVGIVLNNVKTADIGSYYGYGYYYSYKYYSTNDKEKSKKTQRNT